MTPQERQLVDELFDRLSKMESATRDPDAMAAMTQGLRIAPNAVYPLVQTVLVQDEALRRANNRIQELENQGAPQQDHGGGGFLDTMRGAIFGQGQPQGQGPGQGQGSVPNVPPPAAGSRPVWNSGQVLQQTSGHDDQGGYGQRDQGGYGQRDQGGYGQRDQGGYGQPYGGPQAPMGGGMSGGGMMGGMMGGGGGGSFLGTAAAAAAGAVGGSLLLNSIRGMMGGGQHHGFGDSNNVADKAASPWKDESNSNLARDAGINDVGSSHNRTTDYSRDNFSSNNGHDDTDTDSDNFDSDEDA
jgi:uncharacterized protein